MTTKIAIDQLPSLPQVLVQILDAIHSDNADFQRIAEIIRQDTAMTSKLLSVSNSSFYGRAKDCESVERALLFLGTDVVKTIVITASIKQFYSQFNQQHNQFLQRFWRRSLISANLAQVLATLTSYTSPDEAYLCGLLADVGQLILLTSDETAYLNILAQAENDQQLIAAEKLQFGQDHCQHGADLVDSWQISNLMADAVRFHHEPGKLILDAHQLVKIINLASALSVDGDIEDQTLDSADALFGLNESLTRELRKRIGSDVESLAQSLGIDIHNQEKENENHQHAHRQLGERLGDLGELAHINTALAHEFSNDGLQNAARRSVFLTLGITDSSLFLLDDQQQLLCSQLPAEEKAAMQANVLGVKLPILNGRSIISDAFIQGQPLTSQTGQQPLSVIDRQLLHHSRSELLVCWPLVTPASAQQQQQKVGVLVFGCSQQQLQQLDQRQRLSSQLCAQIARAIARNQQRLFDIDQHGPSSEHYQQQIREAVHEASNPLSIIRNYLELLRLKLPEEHSANEGIGLIKEEIDRVGNILLRLKDPQLATNTGKIDVNSVIKAIARIFEDSLCATKQISLTLNLDSHLTAIPGDPEHLKQILTNLLKNAVEALQVNGSIQISSEAGVRFSGQDFVAISVADNGPGISDAIKSQLFSPVTSTKTTGHAGLGLSIIKKLIDDMDGSIMCRSSATSGTQFQLLLPK